MRAVHAKFHADICLSLRQAERRVQPAFLEAVATQGAGRLRNALAALLRQAVGAVARIGLDDFPGVWNARLAALDVLLQAPSLQLVMVRALGALVPHEMWS